MPIDLKSICLIALILLGTTFLASLGFWQLQRLEWKESLIAKVEKHRNSPPLSLSQLEQLSDIEYRPTIATGIFDHTREQHYWATYNGKVGYFIYTPLTLPDSRILFVNRGYVPTTHKHISTRTAGATQGPVTITGLARQAPIAKPNIFVPENDLVKNIYYWRSLPQMTKSAFGNESDEPLVAFFLDADASEVSGDYPQGGVTKITFRNTHFQYALTWFGLSISLLVIGIIFLYSRTEKS